MPLPQGPIDLKGTSLEGLILDRGVRTVTPITITLTTAIAAGAQAASLSASSAVALSAGTALSFNVSTPTGNTKRKQILLYDDASLSTTASTVNIFPAINAITDNEVASYINGLVPVFGLTEFGLQSQDQTVDTTHTLSGAGQENRIVRSGMQFSISLVEQISDRGLNNIIKNLALNFAFKGAEGYMRLTYPDGEIYQGAAQIQNFASPGNQNEVKRCSFDMMFQGTSFVRTNPYTFAAV